MRLAQQQRWDIARAGRDVRDWALGGGALSLHVALFLLVGFTLMMIELYRAPETFPMPALVRTWAAVIVAHALVVVMIAVARPIVRGAMGSTNGGATAGGRPSANRPLTNVAHLSPVSPRQNAVATRPAESVRMIASANVEVREATERAHSVRFSPSSLTSLDEIRTVIRRELPGWRRLAFWRMRTREGDEVSGVSVEEGRSPLPLVEPLSWATARPPAPVDPAAVIGPPAPRSAWHAPTSGAPSGSPADPATEVDLLSLSAALANTAAADETDQHDFGPPPSAPRNARGSSEPTGHVGATPSDRTHVLATFGLDENLAPSWPRPSEPEQADDHNRDQNQDQNHDKEQPKKRRRGGDRSGAGPSRDQATTTSRSGSLADVVGPISSSSPHDPPVTSWPPPPDDDALRP